MDERLIIHWPYLALALATLLFPRPWMKAGRWLKRRRKQRELFDKFAQQGGRDPDDKSVKLARELTNRRNYIDLFRALIGGYSLWHFSFEAGTPENRWIVMAVSLFIVLAGLLVQSVRFGEKISLFAPIFYCAGVCIAHGDPYDGIFAFLLTCAANPVIPNPRMFMGLFGMLLIPFGYLFDTSFIAVLLNAAAVLLLPMVSLLSGRQLVIFSKKSESF